MKNLPKHFIAFLLAITVVSFTNASVKSIPEKKQDPYLAREFTLDGPGKLNVRTSGGSIDVVAQNGNKVKVEMLVRQGGKNVDPNDSEIKSLIEENFKIDISKSSNTITASAERKNNNWFNNNNNISISFNISVPEQMACNLNTSGGSINIAGVKGEQKANTSGGSINLKAINGNTNARTSGGSINVSNYNGKLDASTSGGSISMEKSSGELVVSTSGGSINIDDVRGSVRASTSGGGIKANILALENDLILSTSGGSINAVVPQGLGMDLDLRGNRVNTQLTNFSGQADKDKIVGSMNGGGVKVKMATSGGSVNLKYQ